MALGLAQRLNGGSLDPVVGHHVELETNMKPTIKLRWLSLGESDEDERRAVATLVKQGWPEQGKSYTNMVLQQWWEDDTGKGEWRDIEEAE